MRRQILNAKSGISNHAAAGICDDPCLSKFGALHGLCPQASRQFVGLLCVSLIGTRKFAHCLWLVGHTPGVFKRGKDTEWDVNCGMEEIREFCFKEFAVACLFWNFFVLYYSNNITYQSKA